MALHINGRVKVKRLKNDFKKEFGLNIRVYTGREFADDEATLASVRKGDAKGGDFSPARNMKVGNLEDKMLELFGLKTQISGSDDSYLCDNDYTLAKALEVDEKLMLKRSKRVENSTEEPRQDSSKEEKEWLDNLRNLDEAPESVRASKRFMLESVKLRGVSLEYASDDLKADTLFALETLKLLNSQKNVSGIEYFSSLVFEDEAVIDEMLRVSPHRFVSELLYKKRDDASILEILKLHNSKISVAVKEEFEEAFKKVKELIESDEPLYTNYMDIQSLLGGSPYNSLLLSCYSSEFEVENSLSSSRDYDLWSILTQRVKEEIIAPLEEKSNSFDDFLAMITLVAPLDKFYNLFTDPLLMSNYYSELVVSLDEADDAYTLSTALVEEEYWSLSNEEPEIAEEIATRLSHMLLDMDINEALSEMEDFEEKLSFLPSEYKRELMEKIDNELSEEQKEEYEEIIEALENDE